MLTNIGRKKYLKLYEFNKKRFDKSNFRKVYNKLKSYEFFEDELTLNLEEDWLKCDINIIEAYEKAIKENKLTLDEISDVFEHNLHVIDTIEKGDIIRMEGYKILNSIVLYHHTALLSCADSLQIIHKSGEPNVNNFLSDKSIIKRENLICVSLLRKIYKYNLLDDKYQRYIR